MQLHLATDDKFIDYFINRQRKYFPEKNCRYVIVSNDVHLKYVKSAGIEICSFSADDINALFSNLDVESVYIHFFIATFYGPVINLSLKIKLYWVFWGAEGFSQPAIYKQFLDSYSLDFYKKNNYQGKANKLLHRGILLKSTWEKYEAYKKDKVMAKKAFQRVDFFCHYLMEDYFLLKKHFGLKAKFIDFQYCSIDDAYLSTSTPEKDDEVVFIGNSGSEANNHISLLYLLKKEQIEFQKIYCPLSYSAHPEYLKLVLKTGNELYGDVFVPLLTFMPKDEYDKLLNTAGKFFHNHYRSQAYGNIAYQLYDGGQVYMNTKSSLFRYLSNNKLEIGRINAGEIIAPAKKNDNKKMIDTLLSDSSTNEKFKNVLI